MYVLGIDGGGTKTTGILCHFNRRESVSPFTIIARGEVGATNPTHVDQNTIKERITQLLHQLHNQSNGKLAEVTSVFAGMSGISYFSPSELELLEEVVSLHIHKNAEMTFTNDAITALYSGTYGEPGIVNIAGTGAMTYGVNYKNESHRVGGWGYLIDHTGCGYGIGLEAVKHVFENHDERKKLTILSQLIRKKLSIETPLKLIPMLYQSSDFRKHISALSPIVFQAAQSGDKVASQIIKRASIDMATSIKKLLKLLFTDESTVVPVVCAGGMFHQKEHIFPLLKRELEREKVRLISPTLPPVAGAVIGALTNHNIALDHELVKQINLLDWQGE